MKNILFFAGLLLTTACFGQKYTGDSWAKVKASGGTLTVVYFEQPGLIYKDATSGSMKGLCVDILDDFTKFVQEKYGKKVTINYAASIPAFPNFLAAPQNNLNVMGITNVTITEERKKVLKFTPAFMTNPVVMLTHKDAPAIRAIHEIGTVLKDYSGKAINGSSQAKLLEKIKKENAPSLKIGYANSGSEIINELSGGAKSFAVLELTEFIDATRKQLPVKRQNISFGDADKMGFIMAPKTDWDEAWNEFLTPDYKMSVRYRKIVVDNLGATFLSALK